MARFHGRVGYGHATDMGHGVFEDVITERSYFGDVVRDNRNLNDNQKVNFDLTVTNSISILADAYANENILAIRYVEWAGALWTVSNVEVQRPRLLLRLGGVYNGPTAGS